MLSRGTGAFLAILCGCNTTTTSPANTPLASAPAAPPPTSSAAAPSTPTDAGLPVEGGPLAPAPRSYPLPGASGAVTIDYLAADPAHARVWVPVGETGSADVFDVKTSAFTRVDGFKTADSESHGRKRVLGPSAVSIGDGVAYVGNRATGEVCSIDEGTLKLGKCLKLPTSTDGVVYVAPEKEVWVTTPRDHSLTVLDASKPDALAPKRVIKTDGSPEGYAVDVVHGLFYTNLEDKNRTLAFDLKTHAVKSNWPTGCGADGPRGVAVDPARRFVLVACTDGVRVLDGAHDGAPLGSIDAGAGVDNIEYVAATHTVYAAAARAARVTVARINDSGQPALVATVTTTEGARNAVVDADGNIYVADPLAARLLVLGAPPGSL